MLLTTLSAPKPDPKCFGYELATTAAHEAIWQIWTDLAGWNEWDTGLQSAYMEGPFLLDAKGVLVPDKGPKSKFKVVDFEAGKSYTIRTPFREAAWK